MWRCHLRALERVVLEQTFFDTTVRELHAASSVLDTVTPLALVAAAILPEHFTVAVPLVVLVAALVVVARFPSEETHSVFLVVLVAAFILVAVLVIESLLPLAAAVL